MAQELLTGEQVIVRIRETTDTVILAFSCGKDSIAAWLALRPHFQRIIPYYMYLVPGLGFVERSLGYYERFFGCRIMRLPHPSLYRMLNCGVMQPPDRAAKLATMGLPEFDYADIQGELRKELELGPECYVANGVRAVDSPQRMMALRKYGAINHAKRQFFPIWDWRKDRLIAEIERSGVRLPVDYRMFGRSFDGIDYRFLRPLRDTYPEDYARVLNWFPLADLEIARRQYVGAL